MLGWFQFTSLNIVLSLEKKQNEIQGHPTDDPATVLDQYRTKVPPKEVDLEGPWDVKLRHFWEVRSGLLLDGQVGFLGDVLRALEDKVLGTSWRPIFTGWVESFSLTCFTFSLRYSCSIIIKQFDNFFSCFGNILIYFIVRF